jgi:hypothetical protein
VGPGSASSAHVWGSGRRGKRHGGGGAAHVSVPPGARPLPHDGGGSEVSGTCCEEEEGANLHCVYVYVYVWACVFVFRPENECVEEVATICAMLSAEQIFHFPRRAQRFLPAPVQDGPAEEGSGTRGAHTGHRGDRDRGGGRGGRVLGTAEEELERHAVEDAHSRLRRSKGDHFTYLHIYQEWVEAGTLP